MSDWLSESEAAQRFGVTAERLSLLASTGEVATRFARALPLPGQSRGAVVLYDADALATHLAEEVVVMLRD